MNETIILGGGISGLIALNYIPNAQLYERNDSVAADLVDDTFPKFVHFNYDTSSFCSDVGLTPKIERFKIGIYYRRKMYDFFSPPLSREENVLLYNDYCIKKYGKVEEDKMNGFLSGRREECYILNKNELVEKLRKKNESRIHLNSKVTFVDIKKKVVCIGDGEVHYSKLISTIPINIFGAIAKVQCPIEFLTLKCIIFEAPDMFNELSEYDFIYVVDEHFRFNRVNISNDKRRYIFEFPTTLVDEEDCYQFASEFKLKISNGKEKGYAFPRLLSQIKIDDVRFIGRFAVGDYKLKTEDVIRELRNERR